VSLRAEGKGQPRGNLHEKGARGGCGENVNWPPERRGKRTGEKNSAGRRWHSKEKGRKISKASESATASRRDSLLKFTPAVRRRYRRKKREKRPMASGQ